MWPPGGDFVILYVPAAVRNTLAETATSAGVEESLVWQTAVDQFEGLEPTNRRRLVAEFIAMPTGEREAVEWTSANMRKNVALTILWVFSELCAEERLGLVVEAASRG